MTTKEEFEQLVNNLYDKLSEEETNNLSRKIPNPTINNFPRKIHWMNYYDTVVALNRDFNHLSNYISLELGISISLKNNLNIKEGIILHTKCRANNLKSLLGKYYTKYIQCRTCNSDNTTFEKIPGINKLYQLKCNKCLSTFNLT